MSSLNTRKIISSAVAASLLLFCLLILSVSACIEGKKSFEELPPGPWRGVLHLDGTISTTGLNELEGHRVKPVFRGIDEMKLPFNFTVEYVREDSLQLVIQNGEERMQISDISVGRDRSIAKDTVLIRFPVYDTHIWAKYSEEVMQGYWEVPWRGNYRIPFTATFGKNHRFLEFNQKQADTFDGKWNVTFGQGDDTWPAIGYFEQENKKITGTFRTETGDYRYLAGDVVEDELWLSTFDGSHAWLFHAKKLDDGSLTGTFRSGKHFTTSWNAVPDTGLTLADPDTMTRIENPHEPLQFSFPNTDGNLISLSDPPFHNNPVLVQIMGSWCPNCRDETEFLKEYFREEAPDNLHIVSVAFERYEDSSKVSKTLTGYKKAMNLSWPVLHGGYYDKEVAGSSFPRLNKIASYPTLLFLDDQHRVRHIHTGFNGPATNQYRDFIESFEQKIREITR